MSEVYDYLIDYFELFAEESPNRYVPIEYYPGDYSFFFSHENYGVFIEKEYCDDYYESCSGVILESRTVKIDGIVCKGYTLTCTVSDVTSQFAMVCADLINTDRVKFGSNPSEWFDKWKEVLGNTTVLRSTYPVIGELVVLKDLINRGYDVQWDGPNGNVCDISSSADNMYFEVKSTTIRNNSIVTISEEFQARKADYLCFCRFEEDTNGEYSVSSICAELVGLGYDQKKLESGCKKLGIIDTSLLTKKYHLLQLDYYPVKGNIPDITTMFIGGVKPPMIGKISFTIDLAALTPVKKIPVPTNNSNGIGVV